jgi:LPXTG-motif cell wall-anchored protein
LKTNAFTKVATGAAVLSVCMMSFATPAFAALPAPSSTTVVNVDANGNLLTGQDESLYSTNGNGRASISADGKVVAFAIKATTPTDTNVSYDIYVKNLETGELKLISHADGGFAGNGASFHPKISADGTQVAYISYSSDLVSEEIAPGDVVNVYVTDVETGANTLVSRNADGSATGGVGSFAFSGDGNVVVYSTTHETDNIVTGTTEGSENSYDLFRLDRKTNVTTLVTHQAGNESVTADGDKINPSLNFDGSVLTFTGAETSKLVPNFEPDLTQVYFEKDGKITTVTVDKDQQAGDGNADYSTVSADGAYVAYLSFATDRPEAQDVFVENLVTGEREKVNINDKGESATPASEEELTVSLSADGNKVLFTSAGTNLDSRDAEVTHDVYVRDRAAKTTILVSSNVANTAGGNGISYDGVISTDGNYAVYASDARDLSDTDVSANVANYFVSNLNDIAAPPVITPEPTDPTTPPVIVVPDPVGLPDNDDDRVCSDFTTQADAQAAFEAGNRSLDGNNNGIACESVDIIDPTTPVVVSPTDKDCDDFQYQEDAQFAYENEGQTSLDGNRGEVGLVCEDLPRKPVLVEVSRDNVNSDTRNCSAFTTQAEAKVAYDAGNKGLDGNDNDGLPCEMLPAGNSDTRSALPKTGADGVFGLALGGASLLLLGAGAVVTRRLAA